MITTIHENDDLNAHLDCDRNFLVTRERNYVRDAFWRAAFGRVRVGAEAVAQRAARHPR